MKNILFIHIISITILFFSCTNLDEKIYSSIPSDDFFKNEEEMIMNVGRAYTHLTTSLNHWNLWGTITITSDEGICPYRETNLWWDNGVWIDLHQHKFYPQHGNLNNCWSFIFDGITLCNQILFQIDNSNVDFPSKPNLKAEVKTIRAWLYLNAIDLYGNVPLSTDFKNKDLPKQVNRKDLFEFIESEIKTNIDLLDEVPTADNYGRVTQSMAYTMLAKLYLNSNEWIGKEMWQEASNACDKIISFNYFSLEKDYFSNFKVDNSNSKENIFVIPIDNIYTPGAMIFHQMTLHTLSQQSFNIVDFCWDGFCATEAHYNLYDNNDIRKKSWLEGPQFDTNGTPLMLSPERQLNYRPAIKALYNEYDPALLDDGVRFAKYEYESGLMNGMNNDYVIYRFADILLMKSEALVRMGSKSEALQYINQVRERANTKPYTEQELTLEEILDERSRELAWEGHRRQDLIRFNKWNEPWFEKNSTDEHTKLFPIPYWAIDTNPNLKQNPGY